MNKATKKILMKRFKGFAWSVGAFTVVGLLTFSVDNLYLLELTPVLTVAITGVLGSVLAQITKYLNTK